MAADASCKVRELQRNSNCPSKEVALISVLCRLLTFDPKIADYAKLALIGCYDVMIVIIFLHVTRQIRFSPQKLNCTTVLHHEC